RGTGGLGQRGLRLQGERQYPRIGRHQQQPGARRRRGPFRGSEPVTTRYTQNTWIRLGTGGVVPSSPRQAWTFCPFSEEFSLMRLNTRVLLVLAGLALAGRASAQGTGRSLDIQPGARQNAMGAAGVALSGDAAGSTWWNPAFLGFARHVDIQLTGAQLVPGLAYDVTYNQAAYLQPIEGWGAIAAGLAFLSYGSSEGVDISGTSTGKFDSYEFSSGVSYGTRLLPDFAIGATI